MAAPKFEIGEVVLVGTTKFGVTIGHRSQSNSGNWRYRVLGSTYWYEEDEIHSHPINKEKQSMSKETKPAPSYLPMIRVPSGLYYVPNTKSGGGLSYTTFEDAINATDALIAKSPNILASFRAYVIEETESVIVAARGNLKPETPKWESFNEKLL